MPDKPNPLGPDPQSMASVFEAAKQQALALQRAQLAAQREIDPASSQRAFFTQTLANRVVRQQLAPQPGPVVSEYLRQLQETSARQERLEVARQFGAPTNPTDGPREQARLALGKALSDAVTSGLLTEDRAVSMIVSGGINNQPMSKADARAQVAAALAQAVGADVLSATQANELLKLVPGAAPLPPIALPRPGEIQLAQGAARPSAPPEPPERDELLALALDNQPEPGKLADPGQLAVLVRSVPELLAEIERLEDLVYDAVTLQPCHAAEHAEFHRESDRPCRSQAQAALERLLAGLGGPPTGRPRVPHLDAQGRKAPCCARDGNVGTWLVYGRTLDPGVTFSSERRDAR